MFRATTLALLTLLSLNAAAESKTLRVPAEYPSLAAAVEAAAPEDTIALAAGQYPLNAPLQVSKPVRIQGEAVESTVIQISSAVDEMTNVDNVDGFRIENVTFEYVGPPPPKQRDPFPSLLNIVGGRADVANCTFRKSSGFGLTFQQGATGSIKKCRFEDGSSVGLVLTGKKTSVTVSDVDAIKNGYSGMVIRDGAVASVEGSRCVENKEDGISVDSRDAGETAILVNTCDKNGNAGVHAYGGSTVRIENNTCRGNAESGVQTDTGSTGTVTGNTCAGGRHGVAIRSAGTVVTAEKNHCSESFEAAIAVYFGAKATVTGNTCSKNKGEGIRVTHWETSADVLNNICSDNDRNGIIVDMGGHAAVRGNECSGNKHYGILVSDEESGADVGENITKDNAKGDRDTVAGLPARLEYQVREYEIGAALMNGQTAYLDRIASRLRKYRSRYDDSGWQLYFFYNGLKYGFATFNENTKPAFGAALEKWASDFPDSCTPRIALAMTEMDYAWSCRGTNWASEVTPEGRKGFREHGDVAEKWCKEAEAKPDKDAYLYSTMIWMAKDRGGSKAHIRALLDKGMAIDPECLALYTTTCQSLWPRWGGSKEEIRELFSMVHERTKDKMGEKMYALLIDSQFAPGAVYGDLGDWKLCKAGMEQILEEFPYSGFILNRYCVLACVFDDKEKARELLGKIGENPDYRFWGPNKDNFANAKRWALSDGPRPDLYHVPGGPSGNLDDHEHNHGVHRSPVVSGIAGLTPRQLGFGLLAAGLAMFLVTVLVIFLIVRLTKKRN